jgi:hypothetical protein
VTIDSIIESGDQDPRKKFRPSRFTNRGERQKEEVVLVFRLTRRQKMDLKSRTSFNEDSTLEIRRVGGALSVPGQRTALESVSDRGDHNVVSTNRTTAP